MELHRAPEAISGLIAHDRHSAIASTLTVPTHRPLSPAVKVAAHAPRSGDLSEALQLALNLARNQRWSVFPCHENKAPACPHGFKDASTDAQIITRLWHRHPGPLIGIATGTVSGISVLDIDIKHDAVRAWWQENHQQLPRTRTFRSRSGGLHLYFIHTPGIRNTTSKVCEGLDTRGDGGYILYWFAVGTECLDHSPPAPWPAWLFSQLVQKARPACSPSRRWRTYHESASARVLRRIARAPNGQRTVLLFWGACRLGEQIQAGKITAGEAEQLLVAAGVSTGLTERQACDTARRGISTGVQYAGR